MMNRNLILGLLLGGCATIAACSSDGDDNANTGGTGGTHSTPGGTGGSGGSAGKAGGGSSAGGSAGNAGATPVDEGGMGGEGGAPVVIVPPPLPLNPHFVLIPSAAPSTAPKTVLVAGTDYAHTQASSVTFATGAATTPLDLDDGDAIPVSSAGIGFILERTNDKADLLEGGTIKTAFDLTDPGTATTALTANKAYVGLYNQSLISILDLSANKVSRRIDLSAFNAAGDTDGSVDINAAVYDPTTKIAYILLPRIDLTKIVAPDYTLPCSDTKSLIVGIDTTTDEIVDLNGNAAGQALELTLASPQTLAIDGTGTHLTIAASGCYDGQVLKSNGVEVLDLQAGTSTVAYSGPAGTTLLNLVVLDANNALMMTEDPDDYSDHWFKLNLGTGKLGTELLNVPNSVSYDGTDLIGVKVGAQGSDIVRYDIASDTVTATITTTQLSGLFKTPYGTALVQ